jgi:hypothetical protein
MPPDALPGYTVHLLLGAVSDVAQLYHDLGSLAFGSEDLKRMEEARDQIDTLLNNVRIERAA